jgi:hypothetical protein
MKKYEEFYEQYWNNLKDAFSIKKVARDIIGEFYKIIE